MDEGIGCEGVRPPGSLQCINRQTVLKELMEKLDSAYSKYFTTSVQLTTFDYNYANNQSSTNSVTLAVHQLL